MHSILFFYNFAVNSNQLIIYNMTDLGRQIEEALTITIQKAVEDSLEKVVDFSVQSILDWGDLSRLTVLSPKEPLYQKGSGTDI